MVFIPKMEKIRSTNMASLEPLPETKVKCKEQVGGDITLLEDASKLISTYNLNQQGGALTNHNSRNGFIGHKP